MKPEFKLSPLTEVRLPEDVLASFAALFVRICLLIYLVPVAISLYRNTVLEPTLLGIPIAAIYGLTALLAWRQKLLSTRMQIGAMILLLSLGSIAVTVRNESIMSASTTVLFASIAVMMLFGLRWAIVGSLLFLFALFALYLSFEPPNLIYGIIHIGLAVGIQVGFLIAINALWNMFISSRHRLEQTVRLTEIASTQSRIGLFRHDQRSDTWRVNEVYRQMYGIGHDEEIHGREHVLAAADPRDIPHIVETFKKGLAVGDSMSLVHRLVGDLGPRWVRVNINMLEEGGHQVAYGSIVDIHEHKLRQNELDQVHQQNAELLEHLTLATEEADIRIIEENLTQGAARFLARGKSPRPDAPSFKDRLEILDPDYRAALDHAYAAPGNVSEYPIIGKKYVTGTEWLRQRYVRKMERDGDEIALFMVTSITKEKKSQLQLQRSLQQVEESLVRQDEIAKAGAIGLFQWTVDSDLVRSNTIFREQTGLDEERYPLLSVQNLTELFCNEEGQAFLSQMRSACAADGSFEFQVEIQLDADTSRWLRITAAAHEAEGVGKRIYASVIDLTEHLALEQQLREANMKLQRQSRTDQLTQLANRREMDEYLDAQISLRHRDPASSFSLVMADIDYFKAYNDHYGHLAGDKALQEVAKILTDTARRPADLVTRFGGEEFILILPDTDTDGAKLLCGQIREALAIAAIEHSESPLGQLTVSLGITTLKPMELAAAQALIDAADNALYNAKENGRNRTEYRAVSELI